VPRHRSRSHVIYIEPRVIRFAYATVCRKSLEDAAAGSRATGCIPQYWGCCASGMIIVFANPKMWCSNVESPPVAERLESERDLDVMRQDLHLVRILSEDTMVEATTREKVSLIQASLPANSKTATGTTSYRFFHGHRGELVVRSETEYLRRT
jgi:hypothetical protein